MLFVGHKLKKLHRDRGLVGVAGRLARSLVTSICSYQIQEVRGRVVAERDPLGSPQENKSERAIECVVIEPGGSLEPFAAEFSLPFRDTVDALEERLDRGCMLVLARRASENGAGPEIVGYSINEIGGFSAAGLKGKLAKDVMFIHYIEVAREYRRQRIAGMITTARNEYCRKHGITRLCSAHTKGNIPSDRASRRFGSRLLCHAVRVSFCRGLIVWRTPWKRIERAVKELGKVEGS